MEGLSRKVDREVFARTLKPHTRFSAEIRRGGAEHRPTMDLVSELSLGRRKGCVHVERSTLGIEPPSSSPNESLDSWLVSHEKDKMRSPGFEPGSPGRIFRRSLQARLSVQ